MYDGFDIKCKLKNIFVNVHYIYIVHIIILNLGREFIVFFIPTNALVNQVPLGNH